MHDEPRANVLVVAHKTAATPALLEAVRRRAQRGPANFHLLVPNPHHPTWHAADLGHANVTEGEQVLALALPLMDDATGAHVEGTVSRRHDPMDAIEEALHDGAFDEIILSTLPPGSRTGCISTFPAGSSTSACRSQRSRPATARPRALVRRAPADDPRSPVMTARPLRWQGD